MDQEDSDSAEHVPDITFSQGSGSELTDPNSENGDSSQTDALGSNERKSLNTSNNNNNNTSDSSDPNVEISKRIYQNQKLKDNPFVKQDLLLMSTASNPPRFPSKSEVEKLKSQVDREVASREKFQQQCSKLRIETLMKKQELDQTLEQFNELKGRNAELVSKFENLSARLIEKERENQKLSEQLDQIRQSLSEMKEKGVVFPSTIDFIFDFTYSKEAEKVEFKIENRESKHGSEKEHDPNHESSKEDGKNEAKPQDEQPTNLSQTSDQSTGETKEPEEATEENLLLKQRKEVIHELLTTERNYIRDLNTTIKVYMEPLKESKLVPTSEIVTVFCDIELLVPVNKELLSLLEKVIQFSDDEQMIGETFLNTLDYFNVYSSYCTGQEDALATMNKWLKNEKIKLFLEEARKHPDCSRLNLESFIIKPVQRICKYPLLLREIIKSTPETHADFANLKSAYEKVSEVVAAINRRKNIVENQKKVKEIEQTILFPPTMEGVSLVSQTRQFLLEGELRIQSSPTKQSNRTLLLFNDVIILCRAWGKGNKKWRFECDIPMQRLLLFDIKDDEKNYKFCFELIHTGSRNKFLIACKSAQEKDHWIDSINNCLIELPDSLFCLEESAWRHQLREALIRYRQAAGLPV